MVINRSHISWFVMTVGLTLLIAGVYFQRFHPEWMPFPIMLPSWLRDAAPHRNTVGGTRIGLLFGTVAFLIFIFAALLGARKKKPLWRLGRVEFWLRAHIWLTLLTIPLVGFHCGWHWGSSHTTWALLLYIVVMGSGLFGLAMQQFMPAFMKERLPREVVFEQIPNIRRRAIEGAEQLRKDCAPPAVPYKPDSKVTPPGPDDVKSAEAIREFLDGGAFEYLRARKGKGHKLENQRESDAAFRHLKLSVTPKWLPRVEELQGGVDERRRTDLQTTLQHWLHGWLLIHVPVSMLLIVVTLWHAIVAVRLFIVQP
jgi:hypothetical protein